MTHRVRPPKTIMAVALATSLMTAAAGTALASPGKGPHGPGSGPAGREMVQPDPETIQAVEKCLDQTVAQRKQIAQKRAELRALMETANPDPAKASQLAGELFDLREQLRTKAGEAGLKGHRLLHMAGFGPHGGDFGEPER